jgi:hypothetical protein
MIHAKSKLFFWIGLSVIALFYCLYYLFFMYGMFLGMPLRVRHLIKFVFILMAYGVGTWSLKKYGAAWMLRTWHILYLVTLCLLVLLGIYDWGFARAPLSVRGIADSLQEFLVSPILFVAVSLVGRLAGRGEG